MLPQVPIWLPAFFVVLAVALCATLPWALSLDQEGVPPWKGGALAFGWLTATGLLGASGKLNSFDTLPPPMALVLATMVFMCLGIAFSSWGQQISKLSFFALIGIQVFRLPLEIVMHQAAEYKLMPPQMSYSGRNFDIITGVTALLLALALKKNPDLSKGWIWVWNVAGMGLLLNIVTVAILSFPFPFRVFMNEPANIWVTYFPYIWLPTIMVATAFLGHLVIFRKLSSRP